MNLLFEDKIWRQEVVQGELSTPFPRDEQNIDSKRVSVGNSNRRSLGQRSVCLLRGHRCRRGSKNGNLEQTRLFENAR